MTAPATRLTERQHVIHMLAHYADELPGEPPRQLGLFGMEATS